MSVRISRHAIQRARERGIPRSALTAVARRANRDGEGNYPVSGGYAVVNDDVIVTVIDSSMSPDSRLLIK